MRKLFLRIAAALLMTGLCVPAAFSDEVRFDVDLQTDMMGADYSSFAIPDNNFYACVDACRNDAKCAAFTYGAPGFKGDTAFCWLKDNVPTKSKNSNCISATKKSVPTYLYVHMAELTQENGVDMPGNDYKSFPLDKPDPTACRARCSDDAGCDGYTYVKPGVQGATAMCYLKKNPGTAITNGNCTSGIRSFTAKNIGDVNLEPGTDRMGLDYKGIQLDSPDPRLCADACRKDGKCRAYTYVVTGYRGPKAECYLKDRVPEKSGNGSCVSGIKVPDSGAPSTLTQGKSQVENKSCQNSLAEDIFATLCSMIPNTSCTVTTAQCNTYTRQFYVGSRFAGNATTKQLGGWNSLGGRGKLLGEATLCAFRELSPDVTVAGTNQKGGPITVSGGSGITYKQKLGFLHFDPVNQSFDGYRSLSVCAPILGCYDSISQDISLKLQKYSPTPRLTAGDGGPEIDSFYALNLTTETAHKNANITLPSITVATPVGPLSVDPSFTYASQDTVQDFPFSDKGKVLRQVQDEKGWNRRALLKDMYGVDYGIAFPVLYPSRLFYHGWDNVIALGNRDPSHDGAVWAGTNDRPDRDLSVARSTPEKEPSVEMIAKARVTYPNAGELQSMLPPGLKGALSVELSIFVEPTARAAFSSELSLIAAEAAVPPSDIGAGGTWTFSDVGLKTSAAGSLSFTINTGMDLKVTAPWPIGTIINIQPRWPINLGEKPSHAAGTSSYFGAGTGPWTTSEPLQYQFFKTFKGPLLTGNDANTAHKYVKACLDPGQKVPDQPAPVPTATPGDPKKLFDEAEWPCNLCIFVNGSGKTTLFPVAVPSTERKWSCDMQIKSGCHDLCTMNPETGTLTFKRSPDKNLVFGNGSTGEVCYTQIVK